MDELEGRVATALLAREATAPPPRADLAARVLALAMRRRRRRRAGYVAAVGAVVAAVAAVPLLTTGALDRSTSLPADGGGSSGHRLQPDGDAGGGGARDHYTATLECYSYQHPTGVHRPVDYVGVPSGSDGPRAAIELWWRDASALPLEWNTDAVVERSADAATEVIVRMDQTVAAVVDLIRTASGWRITGVNSCV